SFRTLTLPVCGNVVILPEHPHASLAPGVAARSPLAGAVEDRGDLAIDGLSGQRFDYGLHIGRRGPAMLPRLASDNLGARVIAAAPMQCQLDALGIQDAYDDLHEHATEDAFAGFGPRRGMGPRLLKVVTERHESLSFLGGQSSVGFAVENGDSLLDAPVIGQPLVPASLELGRD